MSKIPAPHRDYMVLGDTDNKQIINKNKVPVSDKCYKGLQKQIKSE